MQLDVEIKINIETNHLIVTATHKTNHQPILNITLNIKIIKQLFIITYSTLK